MRALGLLLLVAACGGEDETTERAPEEDPCEAPSRMVAEACLAPGVRDDGCEAGTRLVDGACVAAGTIAPPFCPPGEIALPGDTVCSAIMDCGAGTWGELPVDASTQHVLANAVAGNGSAEAPWGTIAEAVAAAAPGALVAIAAGNYVEDVLLQGKPLRLWGVCPSLVTITGAGAQLGSITVGTGASGSEFGGVRLTGPSIGFTASGSTDLVVDRVWIHDSGTRGIDIEGALGPTSTRVTRTVVDGAREFGVFVAGASVELDGVIVRDTLALGGQAGRGVNVKASVSGPSALDMQHVVVERSAEIGVYVAGTTIDASDVVVRQSGGQGFYVTLGEAGQLPGVNLVDALIQEAHVVGMLTVGAQVLIEGAVIEDTLPRIGDGLGGRGLSFEFEPGLPTHATVSGSVLARNSNISLFYGASTGLVEGVAIHDTRPNASDGARGMGIDVENDIVSGQPSSVTIRGSIISQSYEMGVAVLGSEVFIDATVVRLTAPQLPTGLGGRGINVQSSIANLVPSSATIINSLIESSADVGLFVGGSNANARLSTIRDTFGSPDGTFGDGVLAISQLGSAALTLADMQVVNSKRAGLGNFGAYTSLQNVRFECQAFDIAVEPLDGLSPVVDNLGGNVCGCPAKGDDCKSESIGINPPIPP